PYGERHGSLLPDFRLSLNGECMNNTALIRMTALALAIGAIIGVTPNVRAQSTTGSINGSVPTGDNQSVVVESGTGIRREVAVDARGRYAVLQLPLGSYKVT